MPVALTPKLAVVPGQLVRLEGAVATFECHSRYRKYGGDHIILIGVVERYSHSDRAPLLFHRGRYAKVSP